MALIAIASDKGAPGVTTAALALAAVWPRPVLLAECDPAGGDLVYRFPAAGGGHLDPRRGVLSLAVVARRGMQPRQVWEHVQKLHGGLDVLAGVTNAEQGAGLSLLWGPIGKVLASLPQADVIADCGRLGADGPLYDLLVEATTVLLVTKVHVADVIRLRDRAAAFATAAQSRGRRGFGVGVVVIAENKKFRAAIGEVQHVLGQATVPATVVGGIAHDTKGADLLSGEWGGSLDRTLLIKTAREVAQQLLVGLPPIASPPVAGPSVTGSPVAGPSVAGPSETRPSVVGPVATPSAASTPLAASSVAGPPQAAPSYGGSPQINPSYGGSPQINPSYGGSPQVNSSFTDRSFTDPSLTDQSFSGSSLTDPPSSGSSFTDPPSSGSPQTSSSFTAPPFTSPAVAGLSATGVPFATVPLTGPPVADPSATGSPLSTPSAAGPSFTEPAASGAAASGPAFGPSTMDPQPGPAPSSDLTYSTYSSPTPATNPPHVSYPSPQTAAEATPEALAAELPAQEPPVPGNSGGAARSAFSRVLGGRSGKHQATSTPAPAYLSAPVTGEPVADQAQPRARHAHSSGRPAAGSPVYSRTPMPPLPSAASAPDPPPAREPAEPADPLYPEHAANAAYVTNPAYAANPAYATHPTYATNPADPADATNATDTPDAPNLADPLDQDDPTPARTRWQRSPGPLDSSHPGGG